MEILFNRARIAPVASEGAQGAYGPCAEIAAGEAGMAEWAVPGPLAASPQGRKQDPPVMARHWRRLNPYQKRWVCGRIVHHPLCRGSGRYTVAATVRGALNEAAGELAGCFVPVARLSSCAAACAKLSAAAWTCKNALFSREK